MKIWPIKRLYRIPLIYGVFSVLWIFFTDKIAFALSPNLQQAVIYSTLKGLLFVVSSSLLIFFLLKANESHKEHLLNEMAAVQRSFNLLFEDNPQPMWIYDNKTLEIMAVNPAACRIYGYSADEFRRLRITDLRKEDEIPTLLKTLSEYKDELRQSGPWEHLKKGGETLIVKVISHPLRSAGFDSTLVSIIDLTEQEKTKDELSTTKQERDDYESFGYTASHDLKSHLRAIIGYSDILQQEYKKQLDEEGLKCVHQIHKAGLTMNQILDDMLVLTGISRKPLQYQKVNLSEVYDETLKILKQNEPERQVLVTIQQNMTALADRGAVRIITQNLLQNAWKYTKKSTNARIEIGCFENSEAETVFYVKDNGLGIDPSFIKVIFEPFKRAHGNSIAEGMGIGLSIVRRAVERHDGRVWVESEPGKGSCFYFTLQ